MKTRSLRTLLTSAYLSTMFASSVAPVRSDATLATTIDPAAARKALESAFSGLAIDGWKVASLLAILQPPQAMPAGSPVLTPSSDPVMTEELMGRLITLTLAARRDAVLNMRISGQFGLNDGKTHLPAKQMAKIVPEGQHLIIIPLTEGRKDIVIVFLRGLVAEAFLTNKTGTLRDAAVLDSTGVRRMPMAQASVNFKSEMTILAKEAAALPPTGTLVAGNNK